MSRAGRYADEREGRLHAPYRLLAAAAVDGRIDPEDAVDLEAHLLTCDACRAGLAGMQADHRLLANPARANPPSSLVRTTVLDAARGARVPRVGAPSRPWTALVAAAMVVAVIGAGVMLGLRGPTTPGALPSSSPLPTPTALAPSAAASRCVTIPAGLSARWHFDSPTEYLTSQPIEQLGELEYAPGVASSALRLFGGSGSVSVPNPANLDFETKDFTISLWVRLASTAGEQVLLERYGEDPLEGWTLTKLESGQLRLAVATDQGAFDTDTADIELAAGPWHHIAVGRSGARFTIFVDGLRAAIGDLDPAVRADLGTELPLRFGQRGDERVFGLDGALDEILVWNGRWLDDREIAGLRRAGDDGFCEAAAGAGYEGSWATTDCATNAEIRDCERWGDRSTLRLVIGPGEEPLVTFEDDAVVGCGPGGAPGSRSAIGSAAFDGVYLYARFDEVECSKPSESWSNPMQLYKERGRPGIWVDPDGDGWGLMFQPA